MCSDWEGREDDARMARWVERQRGQCGDCGGIGDEHEPSCPWAPDVDVIDDELLPEARNV